MKRFYALLLLSVAFNGITVNALNQGQTAPQGTSLGSPSPGLLTDEPNQQQSQDHANLEDLINSLSVSCGRYLPMVEEYLQGQNGNPTFLTGGVDILTLQVSLDATFNCCENILNVIAAYQLAQQMDQQTSTQTKGNQNQNPGMQQSQMATGSPNSQSQQQ